MAGSTEDLKTNPGNDEAPETSASPGKSKGVPDNTNLDGKPIAVSCTASKHEMSLRARGKQSPPQELAKKIYMSGRGKRVAELSIQQLDEQEKNVEPVPETPSKSRKKSKSAAHLDDLRSYVKSLGGKLQSGWQVTSHRKHGQGKSTKTYISPNNGRFRSRVEVAKHLGLSPESQKKQRAIGKPVMKSIAEMTEHGSPGNFALNNVPNLAADTTELVLTVTGTDTVPSASVVTQRCEDVLRHIISMESFAALSYMLGGGSASSSLDSTGQIRALPVFSGSLDFKLIHLRLSTGAYGSTPELFFADIQQVWKNIISAGTEVIAQACTLSEHSHELYKKEVLSLYQCKEDDTLRSLISLKEMPDGENELLSTAVTPGRQPVKDSGVSLDNAHTVQQSHPPPNNPEKDSPGLELAFSTLQAVQGTFVSHDSNSKKAPRKRLKLGKSRKPRAPKVTIANGSLYGMCRVCGLQQPGANSIVCNKCTSTFHTQCVDLPPERLLPSEWYCSSCSREKVPSRERRKESEERTSEEMSKSSGQKKPLKDAAEITKDDGMVFSINTPTLQIAPLFSPTPNIEPFAAEIPHASLEDEPPESPFLMKNENTCKICRMVTRGKSMFFCSSCERCYHLSCFRPRLKKRPEFCSFCICKVCRVHADDDKVLLCEACDQGYHTYCLNPPLGDVPKGDWYCPVCVKARDAGPNSVRQMEVFKSKRKSTEPRRSI